MSVIACADRGRVEPSLPVWRARITSSDSVAVLLFQYGVLDAFVVISAPFQWSLRTAVVLSACLAYYV